MFYKKVLVLKQLEKDYSIGSKSVSGIARVEIENGVSEFFLSVINLAPATHGEYYAFILDKNQKVFCLPIGAQTSIQKTLPYIPDISCLSFGLIHSVDYIPITVAFASTESDAHTLKDFKKTVAEHFSSIRQRELKSEQTTVKPAPTQQAEQTSEQQPPDTPIEYNDEVVATENYFEYDNIEDKLQLIKEFDRGSIPDENELPACGCQEKAQKIDKDDNGAKDEKDATFSEKPDEQIPYFVTVRQELDEIFEKFPPEPALEKMFYKSKWAKIFYSENKHYVVGLIYEENKERYICYGVPGEYSTEPPKELKGFCSFIPLSIFSLHGDGYWMMFQDAITGECKKPL